MNAPTPLEKRVAAVKAELAEISRLPALDALSLEEHFKHDSAHGNANKLFELLLAEVAKVESEKAALESNLKAMTDLAVNKVTEAYPVVVQAAVDAALVEPNRKIEILATALRKYADMREMREKFGEDEDFYVDTSAAIEALKQAGIE